MTKIWANAFWGSHEIRSSAASPGRPVGHVLMLGSTGALVVVSLMIALWSGPLYDLSERTAQDLLDTSTYVKAVLGK
jgi:multicomponent Na+:H+ antiporter subunit D